MKTLLMAIVTGVIFLVGACEKDNQTGNLTLKMTDAPGDYTAVNVDIKWVEVHYANGNNGDSGWVVLPTDAGIYNLLDLQNNVTAVLSNNTEIPAGKINQMRLYLGSNNSIEIDSLVYDLKIPSGEQTGIKINLNTEIQPDKDVEIIIDFDAAKSVVEQGNGSFLLKPHIQVKSITQA